MRAIRTINIILYIIILKTIFILDFIHNLLTNKLHTFRTINLSYTTVKRMIIVRGAAAMCFNKSYITSKHIYSFLLLFFIFISSNPLKTQLIPPSNAGIATTKFRHHMVIAIIPRFGFPIIMKLPTATKPTFN